MSILRSPWTRLEGPADGHRGYGVRDPGTYLSIHCQILKRNERPDQWQSTEEKSAYVNHGRWVIDCECWSGCLTGPAWGVACCFDCGCVHVNISFPEAAAEIERALVMRPVRANQNWFGGETLDGLLNENSRHGIVE